MADSTATVDLSGVKFSESTTLRRRVTRNTTIHSVVQTGKELKARVIVSVIERNDVVGFSRAVAGSVAEGRVELSNGGTDFRFTGTVSQDGKTLTGTITCTIKDEDYGGPATLTREE